MVSNQKLEVDELPQTPLDLVEGRYPTLENQILGEERWVRGGGRDAKEDEQDWQERRVGKRLQQLPDQL